MPLRYTSLPRLEAHLGKPLGALGPEGEKALLAAEAWCDARAGRAWGNAAATTELHTLYGRELFLEQVPVASVEGVELRLPSVDNAWALQDPSAWELVDATTGALLLSTGHAGWWARVAYTPAQGVDSRVSLAATLLAAHWLQPTADGVPGGNVRAWSVAGELSVQYGGDAEGDASGGLPGVPARVVALVDSASGGASLVFA